MNELFRDYEYAVLFFFYKIRFEFLSSKFLSWDTELKKNQKLSSNIASGFLNLLDLIIENDLEKFYPETISKIRNFEHLFIDACVNNKPLSKAKCDDLTKLINEEGHLLFNSYYYTIVDSLGEKHLIPLIPGVPLVSDSPDQLEKLLTSFNISKLPFKFNPNYIKTYQSLYMPCTAGITPKYFSLIADNILKSNDPLISYNFLEDLRVLNKGEDFAQGHQGAIISILPGPKNKDITSYVSAFVLTSIIPGIFKPIDKDFFKNVTNKIWEQGMPNNLFYFGTSTPKHLLKSRRLSSGFDANNEYPEYCYLNESVKEYTNRLLALKADFHVKDADSEKLHIASSISTNFNRLRHVFSTLFPSGPILDRGLVAKNPDSSSNHFQIDISKLKGLIDFIKFIFIPEYDTGLLNHSFPLIQQIFSFLIPNLCSSYETQFEFSTLLKRHIKSIKLHSPELSSSYNIVLFVKDTNSSYKTLLDSLHDFFKYNLSKIDNQLAEGGNLFLSDLQIWWDSGDEPDSKIKNFLYDSLNGNSSILALFLLKDSNIYVPDIVQATPDATIFDNNFFSYSNFWLFESLCHKFHTDFIDFNSIHNGPSWLFESYSPNDTYPKTRLTMSSDSVLNKNISRAISFLGIRIADISFDSNNIDYVTFTLPKKFFKVHKYNGNKIMNKEFLDFYRCYLNTYLSNIGSYPDKHSDMQLAFDPTFNFVFESINFSIKGDNIISTICFNDIKKDVTKTVVIPWSCIETLKLELCFFNNDNIFDSICDNSDSIFTSNDIISPQIFNCPSESSDLKFCLEDDGYCTFSPISLKSGLQYQKKFDSKIIYDFVCKAHKVICGQYINERHRDTISKLSERKELTKTMAHSLVNNLALGANLSNKIQDHIIHSSNYNSDNSLKKAVSKSYFLTSLLRISNYSNKALVRLFDSKTTQSPPFFYKSETGYWSLKHSFWLSFIISSYRCIHEAKDGEPVFRDFYNGCLTDSEKIKETLLKRKDEINKKFPGDMPAEVIAEYDSINLKISNLDSSVFLNDLLDQYDTIIQGLIYDNEKIVIDIGKKVLSLFMNCHNFILGFESPIFNKFDVEIGEDFKTQKANSESWYLSQSCFIEIITNVFKYCAPDIHGNRNVEIKLNTINDNNIFYFANSTNKADNPFFLNILKQNDRKAGLLTIKKIIPILFCTTDGADNDIGWKKKNIEYSFVLSYEN